MIRANIYPALVNQLTNIRNAPLSLNVPTIEFGLEHAADQGNQPAIYVMPSKEKAEYTRGLLIKWILSCEIYVYVLNAGGAAGVTNLLPILDGIDQVLSPQTNQRGPGSFANDLGLPGIVSHCAIQGAVEIFGGYLDSQTIARIPIEIVTAG